MNAQEGKDLDLMNGQDNIMLFRIGVAIFVLLVCWCLESLLPFRKQQHLGLMSQRWWHNISLVVVNGVLIGGVVRLLYWVLPILTPLLVAHWAAEHSVGLFHWLGWQGWWLYALAIIALDFGIYWQHRWMHEVPVLWRLHRVHHADSQLDVSSALRFHPIEILLSLFYKSLLVLLFGVPVMAVVLFDVLLNGMAMFNHSNTVFSSRWEAFLRFFVVTPQMHRIHHSVVSGESMTNFGFNLSLWDRLFQTYTHEPARGDDQVVLGLSETQNQPTGSLIWMLKYPFIRSSSHNKQQQQTTSH